MFEDDYYNFGLNFFNKWTYILPWHGA